MPPTEEEEGGLSCCCALSEISHIKREGGERERPLLKQECPEREGNIMAFVIAAAKKEAGSGTVVRTKGGTRI